MESVGVFCLLLAFAFGGRARELTGFEIPHQYDGFKFPSESSDEAVPVILEAFFDPMCGNCRDAWPTIKSVVKHYGPALSLVIHTFPAPYHHNAYFSARALHIAHSLNASLAVPFMELVFRNQSTFSNEATATETPSSVIQRFISLGVEAGYPPHTFFKGFSDSSTDQAARISFKYGSSRYVTWTPTFLVNGVGTSADETWSVEKWKSILDLLVDENLKLTDSA